MPDWRLTRLKGEFCVTWDDIGPNGEPVRRRYRLGTTDQREAKARAAARYSKLTQPLGNTIDVLWAAYTRDKDGLVVLETMKHTWKALKPHFATIAGEDVTSDHCTMYTKARREAGKSDGSIHTELGHLRTVLVWAFKKKLITFLPDIDRPKKPEPKDRHITKEEADAMESAAKVPHVALAIRLMLSTGARPTAALELTWDRVNFQRGIINLRNPFDQTRRKGRAVVPMNAKLRVALEEAKKHALTPFVIEWAGNKVKSLKRGIATAAEAAGLEDVTPHVLRHSAAVWMAEAGHSMDEIAQFLGHSDSRITFKVYARYSPDHLRSLSDSLDF